MAVQWLDFYLKGPDAPNGCPMPSYDFSYFRDYGYTAPNAQSAYAVAPGYPVGAGSAYYLSGTNALVSQPAQVVAGRTLPYTGAPIIGPNYTETSALDQSLPVLDPPGTFAQFRSAPIAGSAATVVGVPRVTVRFSSLAVQLSQLLGDVGELVVFAKLYDIAPTARASNCRIG